MDERTAKRLAQYRQFGETRLHFSKLFVQTVAFMLAILLAGVAVFRDIGEPFRAWLLVGAGLVLWQTAFVAYRVRASEVAYEKLLKTIETEFGEGALHQPGSDGFGAKTTVVLSLLAAGILAVAFGALKLI